MLHPLVAGSCFGATAVPVSFPQQKGALGPLHRGSAWSAGTRSKPGGFGHSQAERCLPLGWPWALPGAFMDPMKLHLSCGWSHTQLTALTPILLRRQAAGPPPDQSQQLTQVTPVSGHRGCASTRVCERGDLCTLRGYLQTTSSRTGTYCISSFAHRFLLQRLQAWALHLTPQEKSSLLGELLCNKINMAVTHSPAQCDRGVPLWGHSFGYLGENRDVTCTSVGLGGSRLTCQISTDHREARGGSAELRGEAGLWRRQGMSSFASSGVVNGRSSVTMPGPSTRAVGTGRGPSIDLAVTKVLGIPQPASPLPHTLHSSFSMSCWSLLICAIHWLLSSTQTPARGRAERCH